MTYVGLSRGLPPLLADADHARRLIALGFEGEARRILAERAPEPIVVETLALISGGEKGEAIRRLEAFADSYALA